MISPLMGNVPRYQLFFQESKTRFSEMIPWES
jgi:hypothetical protein